MNVPDAPAVLSSVEPPVLVVTPVLVVVEELEVAVAMTVQATPVSDGLLVVEEFSSPVVVTAFVG